MVGRIWFGLLSMVSWLYGFIVLAHWLKNKETMNNTTPQNTILQKSNYSNQVNIQYLFPAHIFPQSQSLERLQRQ